MLGCGFEPGVIAAVSSDRLIDAATSRGGAPSVVEGVRESIAFACVGGRSIRMRSGSRPARNALRRSISARSALFLATVEHLTLSVAPAWASASRRKAKESESGATKSTEEDLPE